MMRVRLSSCGVVVALLCTLAAEPALAQGRGRGQAKGPKAAEPAKADKAARYQFGPRDREIITTYYAQPKSGLPPGLAKRDGGLPPGLEKQLRRNGTLPPGLQKRIQPFPVPLERQLPPLPVGYRRVIVGPHVVVYRPDTNLIVDVIRNIVR
jgi:hypothetical protein